MITVKPLLAFWHAVDLPEVIESLKTVPCDQVHIKYFNYPYPHILAEQLFHIWQEYTHLILVPNDLIISKEHYEMMLEMVQKNDFEVCCGVCNVDMGKYKDYWNVTSNLPVIGPYHERRYRWISKNRYPNMIIQPPFAGFPFMWVKRSVLLQTRINWLSPQLKGKNPAIWEASGGYANDLAFCHNLNYLGIKINCNTSCTMLHLRYCGESQIGKKQPHIEFIYQSENIPHEPKVEICSSS